MKTIGFIACAASKKKIRNKRTFGLTFYSVFYIIYIRTSGSGRGAL